MTKPFAPLPVRQTGEVSPFTQRFCRLIVRLMGWRVSEWNLPDEVRKVVVLGEHHTDNLDSVMMVFIVGAMGRRLSWLVKSELNQPIIGAMIRATGGIFVNRQHANGTVGHVVEIINERERVFLALAPSGTRSKTDRWRTGFYHMALGADVPVALGYLDYKNKVGGIGKVIRLSGDMAADEREFQAFYEPLMSHALHPEKASDVRLVSPDQLQSKAS